MVQVVQRATDRYRDPGRAVPAGWKSTNACVSSAEEGAMGVHFVKGSILFDGKFDPEEPEALIYEVVDRRARLVGAEFVVTAAEWDANNPAPPVILGPQTNLVGAAPIASACPRSTSCTSGRSATTPRAPTWTSTPAVSCAGFEAQPPVHMHGPAVGRTPSPRTLQ